MKQIITFRNLLILALIVFVYWGYSNRTRLITAIENEIGLEVKDDTSDSCPKGYLYSQKDCKCVADSYRCSGLDKTKCENNQNCYSYNRSGSCGCPACEMALDHQCLPVDTLLN